MFNVFSIRISMYMNALQCKYSLVDSENIAFAFPDLLIKIHRKLFTSERFIRNMHLPYNATLLHAMSDM